MGQAKKKNEMEKSSQRVTLNNVSYPPKIILAWAKAIEGDKGFLKWLNENGYKELAMSVFAIYLKDDARNWLLENGYAHLMAMINAAEGNIPAQKWLLSNDMMTFFHIAMAVENERKSWDWLKKHCGLEIFILTKSIEKIKDKIDENHNDIHYFGRDL